MAYDHKLAAAEDRIEKLEAALAPFAEHCDSVPADAPDGLEVSGNICVADVRRARAVLVE